MNASKGADHQSMSGSKRAPALFPGAPCDLSVDGGTVFDRMTYEDLGGAETRAQTFYATTR